MHKQKHVTAKRKSGKNAAWKNHKKMVRLWDFRKSMKNEIH